MFRLLTFCFSAACLAAFVWFGLTVDLGDRPLFGHIRAIVATPEAKELGQGIKTKVDDFVGIEAARKAAAEEARKGASRTRTEDKAGGGAPQDEHTTADREGLRKLTKPAPKPAPKPDRPRPAAAPTRPAAAPRPATTPRTTAARPHPAAASRRVAEAGPGN